MLTDTSDVEQVAGAWRAYGFDVVRLHANWRRIAPPGRRAPPHFVARDPDDPHYSWYALDRAVHAIDAAGLKIILTITGPGPRWSKVDPGRKRQPWGRIAWQPDPRAFGDFASAVASRYGRYVDRYSIWNEPNLYLAPMYRCKRRHGHRYCRPEAPHAYRRLVIHAGHAIRRVDRGAEIAIGELAPIGGPGRIAPLAFLREMACVTPSYRPRRTGPCRHFRAPRADALAYHPHSRRWPPDRSTGRSDDARFGDLTKLIATVDALTRRGRIRAPHRRLTIRLTEFGYQTRPPDRAAGVSLRNQARYLQTALYLASQQPRVKSLIQYQWCDEAVRVAGPRWGRYAGWQSGLRFIDGRPKPALRALAMPLVAIEAGSRTMLWTRPAARSDRLLDLERRSGRRWRRVERIRIGASGSWHGWLEGRVHGRYRLISAAIAARAPRPASLVLRLGRRPESRRGIVPAG